MDRTTLRDKVMRLARGADPQPDYNDVEDMLDLVQRTYIQPLALLQGESTYTTTEENEEIAVTSITTDSDLYEWRAVYRRLATDTSGKWQMVDILNSDDLDGKGVRFHDETAYLQQIPTGTAVRFLYFRALASLSGLTDPALEERWHDLYWLGAAAMLNPKAGHLLTMFQTRLDEFRRERLRHTRRDRPRARVVYEWT